MIKRLTISLLLMGLAAFSLGAAAFAWFSDSATGNVTIESGTADLQFRIDRDCDADGPHSSGYESDFQDFESGELFSWSGIVPGDTTQDCVEVLNNGDGTLTVYVKHDDFGGDLDLRNATRWQYNAQADGDGVDCASSPPQNDQYDTGRGCELDTIAPGETFVMRVDVELHDDGTDQNDLQGKAFTMTSTITGYTG